MPPCTRRHLVVAPFVLAACLPGQIERYELGRRVRLFERAFAAADRDTRAPRAVGFAGKAVTSFFSLDLPGAGRALTEGRHALAGTAPGAVGQWADALQLIPDARLFDTGVTAIGYRIRPFYRAGVDAPAGAQLEVCLEHTDGVLVQQRVALPGDRLDGGLPCRDVPAGDHVLTATVVHDGARYPVSGVQVSFVKDLAPRLDAVAAGLKRLPEGGARRATVRLLHDQLRALTHRRALETDVPATRFLAQAEADVRAAGDGLARGPGEHWIALPCGGRSCAVRVEIPPGIAEGRRVPLVLALHGAGGSENLFFDSYGDGCIRQLAAERGWILAAPRLGIGRAPLPELVDRLVEQLPVDRGRVFLVGHSMGAAAAVTAVCRDPQRYAAVVAFGGGGRVRESAALREVPFFVGAGAQDFALRSARALHGTLEKAGVTSKLREYPDVEHLMIVQVGLPDAFAFLDRVAARGR